MNGTLYTHEFLTGRLGTCFPKVPVSFRTRNQIFSSKSKEKEHGSYLTNLSILFCWLVVSSCYLQNFWNFLLEYKQQQFIIGTFGPVLCECSLCLSMLPVPSLRDASKWDIRWGFEALDNFVTALIWAADSGVTFIPSITMAEVSSQAGLLRHLFLLVDLAGKESSCFPESQRKSVKRLKGNTR